MSWFEFLNIFKMCGKNESCLGKKYRPLRTITIFINTHGGEFIDEYPLLPKIKNSHTIIQPIGKKGLSVCSKSIGYNEANFKNYYKIIPYLKEKYSLNEQSPVICGNKELSKIFKEGIESENQSIKVDNEPIFSLKKNIIREENLSEADLKEAEAEIKKAEEATQAEIDEEEIQDPDKYKITHKDNNSLRQLTFDKLFSISNDSLSSKMGIYIIAVNNVSEDGRYSYLNNLTDWKGEVSNEYTRESATQTIRKYQQNNLAIVHVYRQFIDYCINASEYNLRVPSQLSDSIFRKSKEPPKYNMIQLSTIITLFISLGFEHVNIIDGSCRGIYDSDTVTEPQAVKTLLRQQSEEEITDYKNWETSNKGTGKIKKRANKKSRKNIKKTIKRRKK